MANVRICVANDKQTIIVLMSTSNNVKGYILDLQNYQMCFKVALNI